jgi:hypothetical protein
MSVILQHPQCSGEEPTGGRSVPTRGEQHVDDLALLVDRPIT